MTWKELEQYNYERLLNEALSRVSDSLDKREGSIVYDMIAPAMYELAYIVQLFIEAGRGTLLQNATGDVLDDFALRQGISRIKETQAIVKIEVKSLSDELLDVPIGTKFISQNIGDNITYTVTQRISVGEFLAITDIYGSGANSYLGPVIPLSSVASFGSASVVSIDTLAVDTEADNQLRDRIMRVISRAPFGGNVSDYEMKVRSIDGVGDVQVYPIWNGGGTVKVSVVDNEFNPLTTAKMDEVQQIVDPTKDGMGLGTAPIGHVVTVSTPINQVVNIVAQIELSNGILVSHVNDEIVDKLTVYFEELKRSWGMANSQGDYAVTIYRSRVISEIMSVTGVVNVTSLTIGGSSANSFVINQDSTTQRVPKLGTVTIT